MYDKVQTLKILKAVIDVLIILKKKNEGSSRRFGVRPLFRKRIELGDGDNFIKELRFDYELFFNYTRLNYEQFDYLLGLVGPILKNKKNMKTFIMPHQRLAMTLRYLAVGDSLPTLSFAYKCGRSTCSMIVRETLAAIINVLHTAVVMPSSAPEWKDIASGFWNKWNVPHCLGAIDGKHMQVQAPQANGSVYFNYKKTFSIVLMAAVDANYALIFADVGAEGSLGDSSVFKDSMFGKKLYSKLMNLPESEVLPGTNCESDYFFVGDGAFQLRNDLLKPFAARKLTMREAIYNYRLSRGRRVVENAFGILVARWRIFRQPLCCNINTADKIVLAAVCLHNFIIRSRNPNDWEQYMPARFLDVELEDGTIEAGQWHNHTVGEVGALQNIPATRARNASKCATAARENLADFFSGVGAVEWQERTVRKGFWGAHVADNVLEDQE